jgi:hypothetical protein
MKIDQRQKMLTGPIVLMLLAGTSAPALAKDRLISGSEPDVPVTKSQ